ncbi:MAG: DUF4199 domain-containing protein [Bacteroidales bacterium]|nr:DUF4199 domain-containing protein [Bacteroidales bacterium]
METADYPRPDSFWRNTLVHGLITGGLLMLFYLLMYILNMLDQYVVQLVVYFILLAGGMYYGTKTYRERMLGGFMSYSKALGSTFMISFWAGALYTLFTFVFLKYFDPGLIDVMLQQAEERVLKMMPDISDDMLQDQLDTQRRMMESGLGYVWSFVGNLVISFILALLVSIFLKREDPSQQVMD